MKLHEVLPQSQALYEEGAYAEAYRILEDYAVRNPPNYRILRGMGLLSLRLGEPKRAEIQFQEALKLQPGDSEVRFSMALHSLSQGDYLQGFIDYEARMEFGQTVATFYTRRAPFWDGRPLGADQPLLLHCEQGFGDAIMFVRFLPQVLERAKTVYLACHRELFRLFADLKGVTVLTEDHETPPFLAQLPLISLARIFRLTPETIPTPIPYLSVSVPPRAPSLRPRIGLVWRARPPMGRNRSILLTALRPLAALPVDWVSLQKDISPEETALFKNEFHGEELGSGLKDFRETAEIVQNLDLLITVDTSSSHVAGALGKPVWVLLPQWADWRWAAKDGKPLWYPHAQVFPQEREGDWTAQIAAVAKRLGSA